MYDVNKLSGKFNKVCRLLDCQNRIYNPNENIYDEKKGLINFL